jgi:hypothetical protein
MFYGLLNFLFPNSRFVWLSFLVIIFPNVGDGFVRNQPLKVAMPPPIFLISQFQVRLIVIPGNHTYDRNKYLYLVFVGTVGFLNILNCFYSS